MSPPHSQIACTGPTLRDAGSQCGPGNCSGFWQDQTGTTKLPDGLERTKGATACPSLLLRPQLILRTTPRYKECAARHERSNDWRRGAASWAASSPDPYEIIGSLSPGIGHIAQSVAKQVDRQHCRGDAQAWRDHLPRVLLEVARGFVDHFAPLRCRRLHAQPQKRQAGEVQNDAAEIGR